MSEVSFPLGLSQADTDFLIATHAAIAAAHHAKYLDSEAIAAAGVEFLAYQELAAVAQNFPAVAISPALLPGDKLMMSAGTKGGAEGFSVLSFALDGDEVPANYQGETPFSHVHNTTTITASAQSANATLTPVADGQDQLVDLSLTISPSGYMRTYTQEVRNVAGAAANQSSHKHSHGKTGTDFTLGITTIRLIGTVADQIQVGSWALWTLFRGASR